MQIKYLLWTSLLLIWACSVPKPPKVPTASSDYNKLSKEQEIDAYAQYEWELTHDPATGEVPRHRLTHSREIMESRNAKYRLRNADEQWLSIGPANVGGRTRSILIDAADSSNNTVLAGSVSGGLYKTTTFLSDQPAWRAVPGIFENLAISAMLQDPTNPEIIYLGTGEGWFNSDASRGNGIWKTNDDGVSWDQLSSTNNTDFQYILDLLIDFNGNLYASTRTKGVMKSTDGGASWRQVLGIATGNADSDRGADLEIGPDGTIYATMGVFSIGTVHKADFSVNNSKTGDIETWEDITPSGDYRRIELASAPSDENRLYLLCEDEESREVTAMFRSENRGDTWTAIPIPYLTATSDSTNFARKQAWYNLIAQVDPADEDLVFIGGIDLLRSEDGGETWTNISNWFNSQSRGFTGRRVVHADQHEIQFLPGSSNEAIFTNDGGIYYSNSLDSLEPMFDVKNDDYNTTQFYSCCIWPNPGAAYYMGGTQDNGTWLILSEDLDPDQAIEFFGGDGGYCFLGNQDDPVIIVSQQYIDLAITLDGGENYNFFEPDDDRGAFINPFSYDEDAKILYGAYEDNQYFRISDPINQEALDTVLVPAFNGGQISALTVDPNMEDRLWVGVRPYFDEEWNGHASLFRIDNADTANPVVTDFSDPSWTQFLAIRNIDISSDDPDYMLITMSNFGSPNVWITKDAGETWSNVDGDLADMPVLWGVINPLNQEELIIATDLGVYSTVLLDGDNTKWVEYQPGLPKLRVNMLKIRPGDNQLLAASYGQGLFLTQLSGGETALVASFGEEEKTVTENVGPVTGMTECGEPIRSFPIKILLNRSTNGDSVMLRISFKEDDPKLIADVILPEPFILADSLTEFDIPIQVIDDGFREDFESAVLQLNVIEGEVLINIGESNFGIKDDDMDFINLPVETELAQINKSLRVNEFTHFATDVEQLSGDFVIGSGKVLARIRPIGGVTDAGFACASVSIDRNGTELIVPDWLNGFSTLSKTFFLGSDLVDGTYELELYFDPTEIMEFDSTFLNLNLIRSDLPISAVMTTEEVELIDEVIPQKLNENLARIKVTTTKLGGFAVTNAPDLSTTRSTINDLPEVSIFPNPVRSYLRISGIDNLPDSYYKIFDIAGKRIVEGRNKDLVNIEQLKPGNYLIEVGLLSIKKRNVFKIIKI